MVEQEILLSRIAAIYDTPPFVRVAEGQMKMILRCCGLGEYYEKYEEYLEPYCYYRGYRNDRKSYRIFIGLDSIFSDLLSQGKTSEVFALLNELGNNIPGVIFDDEEKFEELFKRLINLYNILGLDFKIEDTGDYNYRIKVITRVNDSDRLQDDFTMERWLKDNYIEVYDAYESALDAYAQGNFGSAIESCRTSLTGLFSRFKGIPFKAAKWKLGLATVTGDFAGTVVTDSSAMEPINKGIEQLVNSDLASFFGDNLDGKFKKTKAIYAIYSMLSDYGPHRQEGTPEIATQEDAIMMIRMTTDILVWVHQKNR